VDYFLCQKVTKTIRQLVHTVCSLEGITRRESADSVRQNNPEWVNSKIQNNVPNGINFMRIYARSQHEHTFGFHYKWKIRDTIDLRIVLSACEDLNYDRVIRGT
jgi:hypothetical protein